MQLMSRPENATGPYGLPPDTLAWAVTAAVALLVAAPLDLTQLVFVILGAAAYCLLQCSPSMPHRPSSSKASKAPAEPAARRRRCAAPARATAAPVGAGQAAALPGRGAAQRPAGPCAVREHKNSRPEAACRLARAPAVCCSVQTLSIKPITNPSFDSVDFDAQVEELLGHIQPTAQTDRIVQEIARSVAETVRQVLPETEVTGVACGNFVGGRAFGVAVPEVEVVADISPSSLARRVQLVKGAGAVGQSKEPLAAKAEARRLQKIATRLCTDRLVASGLFKFRRSAFSAHEPKVTLLAVAAGAGEPVPFDLSVNSATPLCNAALLEECGQIEPRARALILLVRRWAKDRGICHAARGHLPPYAWTLLVIYFLQVGVPSEGQLLPPLQDFARASSLLKSRAHGPPQPKTAAKWKPPAHAATKMSVGALFRAFVDFYGATVDWRREAVAVHRGRRAAPELAAELHIVLHDDQRVEVAPTIQDPFEPRRNVAANATAEGLARLREEIHRAQALCAQGAALAELLEPWSPEAP